MTEDRPWMVALEEQFLALHNLRQSRVRDAAEWQQMVKASPGFAAQFVEDVEMCLPIVPRADTFAWTTDSTTAVTTAARTLPDDAMFTADILPAPQGWWWVGSLPEIPHVQAILWGTHPKGNGVVLWSFTRWGRTTPVVGTRTGTLPSDKLAWRFDTQLSAILPVLEREDQRAEADVPIAVPLAKFFLAGCIWLQQKILTTAAGHVERHLRRRLEREHQLELSSDVKVVELRRVEYDRHPADDPHDVEWSCRWVVGGHWRLQPYKDGHKAIYILPYVKGPADKPLRLPARTVYEVDR